jgi:ketosteroid isomerase-like protein
VTAPDPALDRLTEALRRRAAGDGSALDGLMASDVVVWHCYDQLEIRSTGADRSRTAREEHDAFRRALPDFARTSTFHACASTSTIVEQAMFTGTPHGGTPLSSAACLVYTVRDGLIARIDIYDDAARSRQFAEVLAHSLLAQVVGAASGTEPRPST